MVSAHNVVELFSPPYCVASLGTFVGPTVDSQYGESTVAVGQLTKFSLPSRSIPVVQTDGQPCQHHISRCVGLIGLHHAETVDTSIICHV